MPNVGPPRTIVDTSQVFDQQKTLDVIRASRNRGSIPLPGGIIIAPGQESPNEFRSRTLQQNGIGELIDRAI